MKQVIPFKKEINLKNKFDSITSLTLEHDYHINDEIIEGVFLVNGTLRSTEASLVDEDFFYKLPFEIALSDLIDKDTINLKINDFTYKIISDEELSLDIKLDLEYEEDNLSDKFETFLNDNVRNEEVQEDEVIEETEPILEDDIIINAEKDKLDEESTSTLTDFVADKKNYVLYKVHLVKEYEDYNSICAKYNVPMNLLNEYNDMKELKIGDKVIIPYVKND